MKLFLPAVPLLAGFLLDCIIGDPYRLPHPVRLIGRLIAKLEQFVRSRMNDLRRGGVFLALTVVLAAGSVSFFLLFLCYRLHIVLGLTAESILTCYLIAAKNLRDESMKVCKAAESGDTERARKAVSMIVGRDTAVLDRDGILRAAVETVAENTSDGVTAPIFYCALGGAVLGAIYKAVNTMDSMIGYQNERFADLGRFAARFDDAVNFIPARLTAILMIAACVPLRMDAAHAFRIWKRDRRKHASPNSAQTESVCAGALHLQLAGDAWYFGELHKKPYIGNPDRAIEPDDIRRANHLMYAASVGMLLLGCAVRMLLFRGCYS